MKSELLVVRGLAEAIFKDLFEMYPSIQQGLRRDLSRLHKADLVSGLPFYTITLPSLAKYLHTSLDEKVLGAVRPPYLGAKSKVDLRPTFLYDLWSKVFKEDGTLSDEVDVNAILALRQVFLFAKKLRVECEERYTNDTILQFREIEKSLPQPWEDTWSSDTPRWSHRYGHPIWGVPNVEYGQSDMLEPDSLSRYDLDLNWDGFRRFTARICSQFGELDIFGLKPYDVADANASDPFVLRPKHGPGAISDKSDYVKHDHLYWTHRLESVFPYDWFGSSNLDVPEYVIYREFPSRLHAVPKTQSGPRLIAAEPTAHQWMQGAVRRFIEDACEASILGASIDFRSQDLSRDFARESSHTGSHATVDLSSASDRLTCRLVEYCFQSNRSLLDALHACRTRVVAISKDDDSDIILLRKFATQGSAVIFPVQTIVYTMIAAWAIALTRNLEDDFDSIAGLMNQVRVFGDDIIIPTDSYPVLVRLLTSLLLKVNASKSFANGKFRESCGFDAYDGEDVTPAYIRQVYGPAPESLESVVECSNNFFMKGWWHAADYLQKTVPTAELKLVRVVETGSGTFGLKSFSGEDVSHLRSRWNPYLHRDEVRTICVESRPIRARGLGEGSLRQFFYDYSYSNSFVDITSYEGGEATRPRSRKTTRWVEVDDTSE